MLYTYICVCINRAAIKYKDQSNKMWLMESSAPVVTIALTFFLLSFSYASTPDNPSESFVLCFSHHVHGDHHDLLYTSNTTSYTSLLLSSINNNMFLNSTPKPILLVAPTHESHVQAAVICGKQHSLRLRLRSGGHDYEGLSYRSADGNMPFVLLDLSRLRSIRIDVKRKESWIESGATIGELYYSIDKASPALGFPGGSFPTVGVGGHLSGGGFGDMLRKYGLAADNILDCRLVDVQGRILDRRSMGEDLFWAMRGGGGASFGVITSYKIQLVDVTPKVTVFSLSKNRSQGAIQLLHQWQHIAYKLPRDVFLNAIMQTSGDGRLVRDNTFRVIFRCLFLGGKEALLPVMDASFPELALAEEDCQEMSWAQSTLFLAEYSNQSLEALLDRRPQVDISFKGKYDYVHRPISKKQWEVIWERFLDGDGSVRLQFDPYGGRMYEIPETAIPFPYRKGIIFKILYIVSWKENNEETSRRHLDWMKHFYESMTPYVLENPRGAYINAKDLDLGKNEEVGKAYFAEASVWGRKYFNSNLLRLAIVKEKVDPENYFWNEQSIPPLSHETDCKVNCS